MNQNRFRLLAMLFVLSLFIRLVALWVIPEPHLSTNATIAYLGGAHLLVEGKGFSDPSYPVFTPPLYAMFMAFCSVLFGDEQMPVKIAQAIADSLTIIILYFIVREVFTEKVALLTCALWAIYPFAIYPTLYIGTETFFTFFVSVFVLLTIYAIKNQRWQYYCGAGVLLGLATLTRGTTQFVPIIFPFILYGFHKWRERWLLNYAMFLLSFSLIIVPWTLRNYLVVNDFIPISTGGMVFLWGASEKFLTIEGRERALAEFFGKLRASGLTEPSKDSKPSEKDRYLIRAGIESYKSALNTDNFSFVTFMLTKFFRLWYATESGRNQLVILGINMLIYPFAIAGMLLARLRRKDLALLLIYLVGYFVVLHWVSLPLFRYMLPIMPYVIAFGGFAIVTIMENSKTKYFGLRSEPN